MYKYKPKELRKLFNIVLKETADSSFIDLAEDIIAIQLIKRIIADKANWLDTHFGVGSKNFYLDGSTSYLSPLERHIMVNFVKRVRQEDNNSTEENSIGHTEENTPKDSEKD
jgi:hypothetical protein